MLNKYNNCCCTRRKKHLRMYNHRKIISNRVADASD